MGKTVTDQLHLIVHANSAVHNQRVRAVSPFHAIIAEWGNQEPIFVTNRQGVIQHNKAAAATALPYPRRVRLVRMPGRLPVRLFMDSDRALPRWCQMRVDHHHEIMTP